MGRWSRAAQDVQHDQGGAGAAAAPKLKLMDKFAGARRSAFKLSGDCGRQSAASSSRGPASCIKICAYHGVVTKSPPIIM